MKVEVLHNADWLVFLLRMWHNILIFSELVFAQKIYVYNF